MTEWTFTFWQMLGMLTLMAFIAEFVGEVKGVRRKMQEYDKKNSEVSKVIKIEIVRLKDKLVAIELETKKALAVANTYDELREKLSSIDESVTWVASTETENKVEKGEL